MYVSCVSLPLGGDHSLALFTLCSPSLVFGCLYVLRMLSSLLSSEFLSLNAIPSTLIPETNMKPEEKYLTIPPSICSFWFPSFGGATSCVLSRQSYSLLMPMYVSPLSQVFFFVTRKRTGCRERMYVSRQFVPLFSFSRTRTVSVLKGLLVTLTVKCLTLCLSPEKFVSFSSSVLCPFIEGQIAFPRLLSVPSQVFMACLWGLDSHLFSYKNVSSFLDTKTSLSLLPSPAFNTRDKRQQPRSKTTYIEKGMLLSSSSRAPERHQTINDWRPIQLTDRLLFLLHPVLSKAGNVRWRKLLVLHVIFFLSSSYHHHHPCCLFFLSSQASIRATRSTLIPVVDVVLSPETASSTRLEDCCHRKQLT